MSSNTEEQNGQNISEHAESETVKATDNSVELSAVGANLDLPGFVDSNLNRHLRGGTSDHSDQYPQFTRVQYAKRAFDLVKSPVGDNIDGYMATNGRYKGSVVRYDRETKDWVRGGKSGIYTMFKPDDGDDYFERIRNIETNQREDAN